MDEIDGNAALSPDMLKALEQAEAGWEGAMDKIAERAGASKSPDMWRKTMTL